MSKQVTISNNDISVIISTFGAEIKSVIKNGKELIWEGNPEYWSGQAPLLFPICGGLKDDKFVFEGKEYNLPKHGYARLSEFELESHDSETAVFFLRSDDESLTQYPFAYELRVIYTLDKSKLNVEYNVKNMTDKNMYFSIGAHEAYACPEGIEEYSIVFDKAEDLNASRLEGNFLKYETVNVGKNISEFPLKTEYFATDALVFLDLKSKKVSLKNRKTGEAIEVDFNGFPYLLLWTVPGAGYICIEPWCGIPDFVDSDYDITKKKGIIKVLPESICSKTHSILF